MFSLKKTKRMTVRCSTKLYRSVSQKVSALMLPFFVGLMATSGTAADSFEQIRPLLKDYCITCHSTEKQEGELDLERFSSLASVMKDADVWERVQEQLALGEMPPKEAKQPSAVQKKQLADWVRTTLHDMALASAGDPGPVVMRRLSNHEYTYSLRDLTGVESLEPAREFPVDGAAGEGFTNVGAALVMSPALLTKYLDAAKEVSRHMVLLDDGVRFSPSESQQDWTDESLAAIRSLYARYSSAGDASKSVQQGVPLDVGTETGRLPLSPYLEAIQGRGDTSRLSPKYLKLLKNAFEDLSPSPLFDPLRQKYRSKTLTVADIESWQKVLWRFTTVGHIGKVNGPKAWQEPVTPLVSKQELQFKLEGNRDHKLYLVASGGGDGDLGDEVVWENPRLVAKGRPDLPIQNIPEVLEYLKTQRQELIADTESCLNVLSLGIGTAPADSLAIWREYLGFGSAKLEPLINVKSQGLAGYNFVQGWVGDNALSVVANSSDNMVRIPGKIAGHGIAVHPAPDRAAVIAWKSAANSRLTVKGHIVHAHPECGNGIAWTVEVRRGGTTEKLASGFSEGDKQIAFGPFENVRIDADQVVALVINPRDGNHSCDLTGVNLNISDGKDSWDLAGQVSPNILAGNPNGPWYFVSQPATQEAGMELPAPIAAWSKDPSPELAIKVRDHLANDASLSHPLLTVALKSFKPTNTTVNIATKAPSIQEIDIPAALAEGATLMVTGRLAGDKGSVQMQILAEKPKNAEAIVAGQASTAQQKAKWSDNQLVTQHSSPIIVNDNSPERKRFEVAFDQFRSLFPQALCYERIVPVDEVVTLTLYYREDEYLQKLMLSESEIRELDRLWNHLKFVSNLPLKQVDAFEQLWQFATQDADPSAFEPLREPFKARAAEFRKVQESAIPRQKQAILELAARAWRRPLTQAEKDQLLSFSQRVMMVRVLTSPSFLYRGETPGTKTGPVNDWELATRLSYFLWSSLPDEELQQLAAEGKLRNPDVLAKQARRMLKDDKRIRRLATEFGCQYLHVRDVATLGEKSERHFPTFNDVRDDMQEEVARFFIDLFQHDRSVETLLDADYSFINKPLAEHYGLPFAGEGWQRIDGLKQHGRGGILGFAATLAKHSGASRSSAILRGMWLSEVVLGDKTPNPPKGVPILPEEPPAGLSERQLIERHSSDPACAGCHARIDPYGFALEGFDAIGRTRPADTKAILYDGTKVAGLGELREYLVNQRSQTFVKQFSRKLVGYALGRSVQLSDQPLIDQMTGTEGHRVADLVEQIVRSPQFREIRGNM
jgi:mono/diheme cytochrome c family protein